MPGMEVFTISGSALGADAPRATPAVLLQNALVALGAARGDGSLSISIDGVIGPGTVKAVNYALKNVIGAAPLKANGLSGRFLNATATKADVQNNAGILAQLVTGAVQRAGGSVPPPPAVTMGSKRASSSMQAAADQAMQQDPSNKHPNLVWIVGGAALIVMALGFMAARKRAAA